MDVFDLYAKITCDTKPYEDSLSDAGKKTASFSDKLKTGLATAAKVGAVALTAVSGAIVALGKASIQSYAEYEQLVGGVETLFKDSSAQVMEYANNAYKTAGLSANAYMETVTSFSASLLQGLGGDTEAAAAIADLAITDMADNANKMGTDMAAIQNAYQGFAKQNYTMLDNLKLGYGGTAGEMARLINDSGVLGDTVQVTAETVNSVSFDKMIEAIHKVQDGIGITGTTAKEASSTIQGSFSALKGAWKNLLTGMTDSSQDLDKLLGNVVDTVVTVGDNLIPRIQLLLPRLTQGLTQLVNSIVPYIAPTLQSLLPGLVSGAASLLQALVTELPTILAVLIGVAPVIVQSLASGITESLPILLPAVVELITMLASSLVDNVDMLVDAAIELTTGLATGLVDATPKLVAKAPELVAALVAAVIRNVPKILSASVEIINTLGRGIANNYALLAAKGKEIIDQIKGGISSKVAEAKNWGKDLIQNFIDGITAKWTALKNSVSKVAQTVKDFLGFSEPKEGPLSNFHTYAPDMMELFAKGIHESESLVTDQIASSFNFGKSLDAPKTAVASAGSPINLTVVSPDGKLLARFIAPYMGAQLQLVKG